MLNYKILLHEKYTFHSLIIGKVMFNYIKIMNSANCGHFCFRALSSLNMLMHKYNGLLQKCII